METSVLANSVTCSNPKLLVPDYITTVFTDQFDKSVFLVLLEKTRNV